MERGGGGESKRVEGEAEDRASVGIGKGVAGRGGEGFDESW